MQPLDLLSTPNSVLLWGKKSWTDAADLLLAHHPQRVETAATPDDVPGLLAAVDEAVAAGQTAVCLLSYEAGAAFDLPTHLPAGLAPLAWMAAYDPADVLHLNPDDLPQMPPPAGLAEAAVQLNVTKEEYGQALDRVREYIASGDTYQVNYTCRARFALAADPLAYFLTLVRSHPVPYAAFVNLGMVQVLSLSPELFLQRRGGTLSSRPMKGTRRRGRTPEEDESLRLELTTSLKDRAENLMILDMERNDLGRVATIGSVRVPEMFTAEKYRSVWQMTSTVTAEQKPGVGLCELLAATFPGASITGAPKLRTMEIIRELEPEPRGLYTGAIGLFEPSGDFTCGLPIRTLVHRSGQFELGIGAGILWDSQTESEYEETWLKSRFAFRATPALKLWETLRLDADREYAWLEEHLARLARSAAYFDFPCDEAAWRKLLTDHAAQADGLPQIVRLELDAEGRACLTPRPLPAPPTAPVRILLSATPVDAAHVLLYHKTSQRDLYETERQSALEQGFFEVLFTNQDGQLTEGSITNLFLHTAEGWFTPPVTAGLLPGIWREQFLRETGATERLLTIGDLAAADEVLLGNSVRGAVPVGEIVSAEGQQLYPSTS